jgi:5-methyltetrahydrofolate--homocysteine methyltransferase
MNKKSSTNNARLFRKTPTGPEQVLWSRLRNRQLGFKFRRQQPIGKYIVDFACIKLRLLIELDGEHHTQPGNIANDRERTKWLESQGYLVLRFWNNEVTTNLDEIIAKIKETLYRRHSGILT